MTQLRLSLHLFLLGLFCTCLVAQEAKPPAIVPTLVPFNGAVKNPDGKSATGIAGLTFGLYKEREGGAPIWLETQNVLLDSAGHYTVLLGSSKTDGLPLDVFASGEARWLGVRPEGQEEQPRVLLLSVPYALKAADAATLGGRPASAYVTLPAGPGSGSATAAPAGGSAGGSAGAKSSASSAKPASTITGTQNYLSKFTDSSNDLGNSEVYDTGSKVGIGTKTPGANLDVFATTAGAHDPVSQFGSSGASDSNSIKVYNGADGFTEFLSGASNTFMPGTASGDGGFRIDVGHQIFFGDKNASRMMLDPNGRLGIGTTAPGSRLTLQLASDADAGLRVTDGTTKSNLVLQPLTGSNSGFQALNFNGYHNGGEQRYNTGKNRWRIAVDQRGSSDLFSLDTYNGASTSTVLAVTTGGNVGIGTTTPAATVDVNGNVNAAGGFYLGGVAFAFGSTASTNSFFGFAGNATLSGDQNTGTGYQALHSMADGVSNTGTGYQALYSNTSGYKNTAVGDQALYSSTLGFQNTATGYQALYSTTVGSQNTATGYQALYADTLGNGNTATGYWALASNTTGTDNDASGYQALYRNTTGNANTATGYSTLASNTTGLSNTATGYQALYSNTTGGGNTATGAEALTTNTTGENNTADGGGALGTNAVGSNNTAVGGGALASNSGGNNNTAVGSVALSFNNFGNSNSAVGWSALQLNTTGGDNSAMGYGALYNSTTGIGNTAQGLNSLYTNATGNYNTALGYSADVGSGGLTNATAIGAQAYVTQSNTLILGSINGVNGATSNTNVGIGTSAPDNLLTVNGAADKPGGGSWGTFSDARLKTVGVGFDSGLAAVLKLRPVRYRYKEQNALGISDHDEHIGFVAQEVEKVIPEAVSQDAKGYRIVNNDPILWAMLNAIQEQQQLIRSQQETIKAQAAGMAQLVSRVNMIQTSLHARRHGASATRTASAHQKAPASATGIASSSGGGN